MTLIEAILIAIALSMDCFTVSITCGILQRRMGSQVWVMAFMFGFFQALMAFLGWAAVGSLNGQIQAYDHWVAFFLLGGLGVKMIWDGFHPKKTQRFNPSRMFVLFLLSIATSIDALAAGCSFVGMGIHSFHLAIIPILLIGIVSLFMSFFGKYIGIKIGHRFNWPASQLGGAILIVIGLKVLIQHLSV